MSRRHERFHRVGRPLGFRRCFDLAEGEGRRIASACGRPPSFNMVLCQSPEADRIGQARYAAMVCSVASGATTADDHEPQWD